jgi:hypothetical protein
MALHHDVGIHGGDALGRHLHLRATHIIRGVEHLTVQVRRVDHVVVDEPEGSDARGSQVLGQWAAEAPRSDEQNPGREQRLLALEPDFGQGQVAPIAIVLVRPERCVGHPETLSETPAPATRARHGALAPPARLRGHRRLPPSEGAP